jgi:hypothetical protein
MSLRIAKTHIEIKTCIKVIIFEESDNNGKGLQG